MGWRGVRSIAALVVVGLATIGSATTDAGAQTGAVPGVSEKAVRIGFISSQAGVASSGNTNAHKSCQARVDAENAKGGVNGRKIKLDIVDDQSANNLTAAQDLVRNRDVFAIVDDSALAFLAYRFIRDAGVPMIGAGFDGTYYYDKGNENIISG